jgi:hypothetical protein
MEARITYKEHLIFDAIRRDAGGCFWLPVARVSWGEAERKHAVCIKGRSQDRFVYSTEARIPLSQWVGALSGAAA